jgi:hypothetical protein
MTAGSRPEDGGSRQAGAQLAEPEEPAAASPPAPRDLLRSPALQGGLAFLFYLAALMTTPFRPIIEHPAYAQLDQKIMDPNLFVWGLGWWPYAIGHGLNPLYSHEIGSLAGQSLAWMTTVPPLALLAAPLTLAAGPVVSFNLLTALALPVSGWAAFVLCRRLTGRFWPALVGGAAFGFSAYEMNHAAAGQLNLAYSLLLPLLAYLVVIWRDGSISTRTFVIVAGLALTLQFYLMMEVFADLTAIVAVSLLVGLAVAGRDGRPEILRLAKTIGLAYVIAIVLAAPQAVYALVTKTPNLRHPVVLDVASLVIPHPDRTFGIAWLTHLAAGPSLGSSACYLSVPLLLLAVLLAATRWSSRIVRFLSCMLVFSIVAALGSALRVDGTEVAGLPWSGLWRLPILRNADPSRLMVFAYLVLAVATALYLAGPARRAPWVLARWSLAVLVVVCIGLDTLPIQINPHTTVPKFISSGAYHRQLSPGEIVVVVSQIGNAGMLWQAHSDFYMRLAGGYINAGLAHRTDLPPSVQDLSSATPSRVAKFERFVRTGHVGAILLDAFHEPKWVGIFWRVGLKGHRIGNVIVYKTNGCQSCHPVDWAQLGKQAPAAT